MAVDTHKHTSAEVIHLITFIYIFKTFEHKETKTEEMIRSLTRHKRMNFILADTSNVRWNFSLIIVSATCQETVFRLHLKIIHNQNMPFLNKESDGCSSITCQQI